MKQLEELLANFESVLEQQINKVWEAKNLPINLDAMAIGMTDLCQAIIQVGDFCHEKLQGNENDIEEEELFKYHWVNFECADLTKSLVILWRDILFQQQKGQILKTDRLTTAEALRNLNVESQEILEKAVYDLKGDIERAFNWSPKKRQIKISEWSLQQNPWPTYKKQFEAFPEQGIRLQKEFSKLLNIAINYEEIEALVFQTETYCHQEIAEIKQIAKETAEDIEKEKIPSLSIIAQHLEDLESRINLPHHFNAFTEDLELKINHLVDEIAVPMATEDGMIAIKDLTFRRSSKQWLDAEILPLLYEVWELTEKSFNGLKMALINIKNRVILLIAEEKEGKTIDLQEEVIFQPLKTFSKNLAITEAALKDLKGMINHRLMDEFNVSAIYETEQEFLPIPLTSTLNQLRQSQNRAQNRVVAWFENQWFRLKNFRDSVEQEDALSNAEKIVRLIKNRTSDPTNGNYSSIFLTKGFIGDSFAVGRKKELNHAKKLVDDWKLGYRGSLVLTGQRFAGKTLLGELIAHRFFDKNTLRLSPNSLLKFNGRKITTRFDLQEALAFVKKSASQDPLLIWIDDFELWWDDKVPLNQNVHALRHFIDNFSSRFFVMVSTSNWLKAHLDLFQETSKIFQAEINVDKMPVAEVRESILIRHGATHKTLVEETNEEVTPYAFQKKMDKVYRLADGNIGEALNRWSFANKRIDEEKVYHETGVNYQMPNFLNPDIAILLTLIMMEKRTNERRLRKLFGPVFKDKFAPILKRLLSMGLLIRALDGWLEINEVVVNDLGKLLEEKGYLKFYRQRRVKQS